MLAIDHVLDRWLPLAAIGTNARFVSLESSWFAQPSRFCRKNYNGLVNVQYLLNMLALLVQP